MNKKTVTGLGVGLILVIAIVFGVYYFVFRQNSAYAYDKTKYQAVFLSNGQVYFGKLTHLTQQYAEITDIYYLIVKQPLQPQSEEENKDIQNGEYTLIKLGDELHGPSDKMIINRDHILFIEDLKIDGKVAIAIAGYKTGND